MGNYLKLHIQLTLNNAGLGRQPPAQWKIHVELYRLCGLSAVPPYLRFCMSMDSTNSAECRTEVFMENNPHEWTHALVLFKGQLNLALECIFWKLNHLHLSVWDILSHELGYPTTRYQFDPQNNLSIGVTPILGTRKPACSDLNPITYPFAPSPRCFLCFH